MARTRVSRSRRRTPRSKSRSKRRGNRSRRLRNTLFNPRVNLNQFKRRRRSAKRRRHRGTRRLRMINLFGGAEDHSKDEPKNHDDKCENHEEEQCKSADNCEWENDKCKDKST